MTLPSTLNISAKRYPLAPNAVFWTVNGEAHLRGFQMVFIRLAGCSVGCDGCDTDYTVAERDTAEQIAMRADEATPKNCRDRWAWITGGEPTDYDLRPLLNALKDRRFSTAVATSGHNRMIPPVDWLSVSPHDPAKWIQTYGNEVKIVPGLNGLDIDDWRREFPDDQTDFMYRYVQPLSVPREMWGVFYGNGVMSAIQPNPDATFSNFADAERYAGQVMRGNCVVKKVCERIEDAWSLARCREFLKGEPNWSLSRQDHLYWALP